MSNLHAWFKNKKWHKDIYRTWMETGCVRWGHEDRYIEVYALALAKNAVVVVTGHQQDGAYVEWRVEAFDKHSGKQLWQHAFTDEPVLGSLCIDRAGRVITSLRNGGLICIAER